LDIFVKTSGVADLATVIQDETFSIFGLMKLSDTTRDPKIYPQDAVLVFNTVKAVLAKFSRIWAANKTGRSRAQITSHFLDRIVFSVNLFSSRRLRRIIRENKKRNMSRFSLRFSPRTLRQLRGLLLQLHNSVRYYIRKEHEGQQHPPTKNILQVHQHENATCTARGRVK